MASFIEQQEKIRMAGVSLSKQIYKDCTITTDETGPGRWTVAIDDGDEKFEIPEKYGSNADAMRAGKKQVDEWDEARHP